MMSRFLAPMRVCVGTIVIFGVLAGCPAAARGPEIGRLPNLTSDDPRVEAELHEADDLAAHAEHQKAAERYRAFLTRHASDRLAPLAQLGLGRSLLATGQPAEALILFRSIAANPDTAVAEHGRFYGGIASERLAQHGDAITALTPMVGRTIDPADTTLLLSTLAAAYENSGRIVDAIATLQSLTEETTPNAEREAARAHIVELAAKKASPADIRRAMEVLDADSYAFRQVAVRAVRDADASRDHERTRELLALLKEHGVSFDEELTAIALRAERPSDANPAAIGAILPLSGRARRVGELALRGLMLSAGLPARATGDEHAAQLIFRDDAGSPEQAVEAVNELVSVHRVIAIIGPMDTQVALAAAKRAQALGVPLIALTPGGALPEVGSMVFRYFPTPLAEAEALVKQAQARGARRFAVLHPDNAYGETMLAALRQATQSAGASLVATQSYPPSATSFGPAIARLAKSEFDALFVPDAARTLALVAPALAASGLWSTAAGQNAPSGGHAIVLLAPSIGYDAALPHLAGRYLQGALFSVPFDAESAGTQGHDFVTAFKQQFSATPDAFAAFAYDAYKLVRSTVDAGAKTRAELATHLPANKTAGLVGPGLGFAASREPANPTRLLELRGETFAPAGAAP